MRKNIKKNNGFTLVEVLVAIVVISIVAINMMPLLTQGIKSIYTATQKNKNLFEAEGDMQYKLADQVVYKEVEIPVKFENKNDVNNIKGGLVQSGNLYSFIAAIPTIKINPSVLTEGYKPLNITIQGNNTHFSNESNFSILTKSDEDISNYSYSINSETSISLDLGEGLSNSESQYTIKIKTERDTGLEEVEPEVVRAKLQVNPPRFLAAGNNGEVLVSANGEYWSKKDIPTSDDISSAVRVSDRYIVSTNKGEVFSLIDDIGWQKTSLDLESINDLVVEKDNDELIVWAIGEKAIGKNNSVFSAKDGSMWRAFDLLDSSNENIPDEFFAAAISDDNKQIYFCGAGTIIRYDKNNDSIKNINLSEELGEDINTADLIITDIVYGNEKFIFIGHNNENNRVILSYNNDEKWSLIQKNTKPLLNSIYWSKEYEKFIAVGNEGTIISSENGNDWIERSSVLIDTTINLQKVISFTYNDKPLILIGGKFIYNNYLYYSTNENDFTELQFIKGANNFQSILGITSRY